jgi:pimeloyl-ACP methyl ester carboxylesterase
MSADVQSRFSVDVKRVYMAGMSGGARVALWAALGSPGVAGVIASSAGYMDGKPRKSLAFPVFATAGTEDFNRLEMRQLDEALTSPHHLAIFEGGHVWLSSDLALEAVEWMEVQAMKTGRRPRDETEIDRIFSKRLEAARVVAGERDRYVALRSLASDFEELKDVAAISAQVAELGRDKRVRDALKKDRDEDAREQRMLNDIRTLEASLASEEARPDVLADLRSRWKDLSERAGKPEDSADRRLARRVLGALSASITTTDPAYLKIIGEYRIRRGR